MIILCTDISLCIELKIWLFEHETRLLLYKHVIGSIPCSTIKMDAYTVFLNPLLYLLFISWNKFHVFHLLLSAI
jgi:hypothetical protein